MEHHGADAARPYVKEASATFPVLVDEEGVTSLAFGFKVVPNGVLVDEDGIVRYAKYGGFSVQNPEHVAVVERFLQGEEPLQEAVEEPPYRLEPTEQELVETRLRLGRLLDSLGRHEEAISEWERALRLDPMNFVIRKQIWAARYPEKFHPTIDFDWQKEQLQREREQEIASGICGPDGCPLPTR